MRFYASPEFIFPEKGIIEIRDKDEIRHIYKVMRLKNGDKINVFDGIQKEYTGVIENINNNCINIRITGETIYKPDKQYNVTLYQAVTKKVKMDYIIEKAVELGVDRIVPILTERTVPLINEFDENKLKRWKAIAITASKQCGRIKLPEISPVITFERSLIDVKGHELILFAAIHKDGKPLKEALRNAKYGNIAVFIGPEGDFSQKEVSLAKDNGFIICSLGSLVLRVETAMIYLLSCLTYEYSDYKV